MQRRQRNIAARGRPSTSSSISTGRSYSGPPWTTRCPTATGSSFCVSRSQAPAACKRGRHIGTSPAHRSACRSGRAIGATRAQPRPRADAVHLAFDHDARARVRRRCANTWNLTLDEPALTTRIVSMALTPPASARRARRACGVERRDRAGGHAGAHRIRARGQYDRHPRAEHDAGRIGLRQEGQILGQHVAGFEIGHDQDLRAAGDLRLDALDPRRLRVDRIVEGERAVEDRRR